MDSTGAGTYLVFQLGREAFAFPAARVREIMGRKCLSDLCGRRLPLVDLRLAFDLPGSGATCVIVLDIQQNGGVRRMGMVVDAIAEVVYLGEGDIEKIPYIGDGACECLTGMTRRNGKLRTLIDVDRVLAGQAPDGRIAWVQ